MNFANALQKEAQLTYTENRATALNGTGDACLDLFGSVGGLRNAEDERIERLFSEAYRQDPLLATKIAFYTRDVRGGLGERKTFRSIIRYMAHNHAEALRPNLDLLGVYGRYDDLYALIDTPLENDMWAVMKAQFEEDLRNLEEGNAVSMLAKWIKTPDASSRKTRTLGIETAKKLGYSVYDFKRLLRRLRKQIGVVESLMSAGKWDEIRYSAVPSRAMLLYRSAFYRHDEERFAKYIQKSLNGEETIHSQTLYPYDIVEKYLYGSPSKEEQNVMEAQWRTLPDYVEKGCNALVMADVSGSMFGRPMASSIGLALYFAQHNTGAYHNLFMTFSKHPQIVTPKGETLAQQIRSVSKAQWGMNTNLEAAFEKVLNIAITNHIPEDDMVKSIIVISDMEIDECSGEEWTFYDNMVQRFSDAGYQIPNVIFWNVDSRHDVFHADAKRKGVQLCSGQSAAVFRQMLNCVGLTAVEAMHLILDDERYSAIRISA